MSVTFTPYLHLGLRFTVRFPTLFADHVGYISYSAHLNPQRVLAITWAQTEKLKQTSILGFRFHGNSDNSGKHGDSP